MTIRKIQVNLAKARCESIDARCAVAGETLRAIEREQFSRTERTGFEKVATIALHGL